MKIEMKRFIILFIIMFNVNLGFSQPTTTVCPCCEHLIDDDTGEPKDGMEQAYLDCDTACNNAINAGEDPCPASIDSGILILILLGTSFGIYKVYKNKKRQFEN